MTNIPSYEIVLQKFCKLTIIKKFLEPVLNVKVRDKEIIQTNQFEPKLMNYDKVLPIENF